MPAPVRLVVPCWNEAARLDPAAFRAGLDADPDLGFVFVDDGSSDGTRDVVGRLAAERPDRVELVALPANVGKGEAVRAGLLRALATSPTFTGWWDADLSTPLDAVALLRRTLAANPARLVAMGSRVRTLGTAIERRLLRHYAGRIVATRISRTLRQPTYDTQCGAKLLRVANLPEGLFAAPFVTRWLFDVEVLARLERRHRDGLGPAPEGLVVEVPLPRWRDVPGSKVRPTDFVRALLGLRRIRRAYGIGGARPPTRHAPAR